MEHIGNEKFPMSLGNFCCSDEFVQNNLALLRPRTGVKVAFVLSKIGLLDIYRKG